MRKFLKDNCSLMEHQVDCCRSLISKRRALFVDAVGNGKCKSGDSRLFFNGGYPKLKDLVSGASEGFTDLFGSVYQWAGKSASASSFYKESNCRLYHWLCKSGREFNGTADHKVLALRRGKSVPRLYKMSSLSAGDYILRPSFMLDLDTESLDVSLAHRCILYGIYLSRLTNAPTSVSSVTYYGYKPLLSWIRGVECSLTGAFVDMYDFASEDHGLSLSIPIESSCLGAWVTSTSDGVCEAVFALPAVYRFLVIYGYLVGYDFIYTTIFFASRLSSMVDSLSDLLESLNVTFYHDMDSGPEKGTTYHLVCDRGGSSLFLRYCNLIMPFLHDLPSEVRRPWNNLIGIEEYYQTANPRGSYSFVRALPSSFVASLRAFNKRFPKGFLPKEVASWLSSIDQTGTMSTRTLNVLTSAYTSVGVTPPDALIKLSGCEFDELVSRRETIEAVYDITVPDGHVFVSDGCLNHNTVCCLYSYSYLRSRNSVDLMVVFTPLNAYTKEIWLKDAQKFTNLRCLSIDELKKRVSSGQSVEDAISDVDVLYGKHTHCKTDYALLRELYLLGTKKRILTVEDECFVGSTHVICRNLPNFKNPRVYTRSIRYLVNNKVNAEVACVVDGNIEWRPIVNWFSNGPRLVVDAEFVSDSGESVVVASTLSHKYQSVGRGWVALEDLRVGERVFYVSPNGYYSMSYDKTEYLIFLPPEVESVLRGSLLGDATVSFGYRTSSGSLRASRVVFIQGSAQRFYLEEKHRIFGECSKAINFKHHDDSTFGSRDVGRFSLVSCREIDAVIESLYCGGRKKMVSRSYLNSLTPISLAVWYMDDGSFGKYSKGGDYGSCYLHTQGFTLEENECIVSYFKEVWNVCFKIKFDPRCKKYFLKAGFSDSERFLQIVSPYILREFQYKVGFGLIVGDGLRAIRPATVSSMKVRSDYEIKSIIKLPLSVQELSFVGYKNLREVDTYDLEVADSHSFTANGLSVHNCHAFKNNKTELTTTMSLLLRNTYALWGITATILSKNCIDTYHIINFVYPRFFRSIRGFQNQFCRMESKIIGRNPDGSFKKVYTIVDYKDPKALMDYCSSVLVVGSPPVEAYVHMVPYTMSDEESDLYARVANGIMLSGSDDEDDTSWLKRALSRDDILSRDVKSVKDLERHSSRFIYLQAVTDGCLNDDGTFGTKGGNKVKALIDLCRDIASRNESALIYADYYTTVDVLLHHLRRSGIKDSNGKDIVVVEQSSRVGLKKNQVTESMCSLRSYFIIMTRSATESANFTFLNNAILFDIPVVPISVIQFVGRITRRSSKFLGNLHAWYFRNGRDISEYKLRLVGFKTYMQERISFEVPNFPREYVKAMTDGEHLKMAKRVLLWHDLKPQKVKRPDAPASPQGTLF